MALTDNLLAFYKLNDLTDSSGNNRTLTNNGNVSFASGKIGNAAVFDGSNYLTLDQAIALGPDVTISGWVKAVDTTDTAKVFFGHSSGYNGYIISLQGNSVFFGVNGPSYVAADYSSFIDQWIHVAAVATGNNWVVYVNGIASAPTTVDSFTVESTPSFGTMLEWMDGIYTGELDGFGIWNRALSDSEVAALYNNGTGLELDGAPSVNLASGLQAFYKLSDTSDSSGNNRTLTNNGNVSFASGKLGNAAVFDGSNWLVDENNSWSFGNGITFSAWIKITNDQVVENKLFGGWVSDGNNAFYAAVLGNYGDGSWNGQLFADLGHGLANFSLDENNILRVQPNTWTFVTFACDNTNWSAWVNGDKVTFSTPATINTSAITSLKVGAGSDSDNPFNGQIDAVGIWNRALSDSEVAALYNSGNGLELDGGNGGGGGGNPTLVKMEAPIKFFGKVKFGV